MGTLNVITGTLLEDILLGTAGDDSIAGMGSADDLIGSAGNDILDGGAGDDYLLRGGDGNDTLLGGIGNEYHLVGDAGDDSIDGGAGTDNVEYDYTDALAAVAISVAAIKGDGARVVVNAVGFGTDTLVGVEGALLVGSAFADTLTGGGGDDVLSGGAGRDRLNGGGGNDFFYTDAGNDTLAGGAGFDTVRYAPGSLTGAFVFDGSAVAANGGSAVVKAGALGTDTLIGIERLDVSGGSFDDQLSGGSGNDLLNGGPGNDTLLGNAGDDYLSAMTGNDLLSGGAGNDTLSGSGSQGDCTLQGGEGIDALSIGTSGLISFADLVPDQDFHLQVGAHATVISGVESVRVFGSNFSNDTITGSAGDDLVEGRRGNDSLSGGAGNDVVRFRFEAAVHFDASAIAGDATVVVNQGGLGRDTISGFEAVSVFCTDLDDWVLGGTGGDSIDGAGGADTLAGGSGADTLLGGDGADLVRGLGGADVLEGAWGNDTLVGAAGNDTLGGGQDADCFRFGVKAGTDTITDFRSGSDRLEFDNAAFAAVGADGALAAGAFVLGPAALEADDRLVYSRPSGKLYYDGDGNGAHAPVLVATLGAGTQLLATDILVI